ncbi:MAG: hypothetical protein ACRD1Z_05840, partial [Vicinamibacteria bacterium]
LLPKPEKINIRVPKESPYRIRQRHPEEPSDPKTLKCVVSDVMIESEEDFSEQTKIFCYTCYSDLVVEKIEGRLRTRVEP